MKSVVFLILLALLFLGMLTLAFNFSLVHAQAETVYIESDGSVLPSSAPISTVDNVTYTFTADMSYTSYHGIIVERNNIVIDGNGHALRGNSGGTVFDSSVGLNLTDTSNVTIKNVNIENFQNGIYLSGSNGNIISGNTATANSGYGVFLYLSSDNSVVGNNVTANGNDGVYLDGSSNNNVSANNATGNVDDGIWLYSSSNNNTLSGNNVAANGVDGIDLWEGSNNNNVYGNDATANDIGVYLWSSSNNTVSRNNATANTIGVYLDSSSNNNVIGNNATANDDDGIYLASSSDNTISENNITALNESAVGAVFWVSPNNTVSENIIANNSVGIDLEPHESLLGAPLMYSSNNAIYHNNFMNNQIQTLGGMRNAWDNGYPFGGNYWTAYNGTDLKSGQYQNVTGSDGIGDTPYVIDANNTDYYPLMGMFSDFNVAQGVDVQVVSNSTVSDFQFNGTAILFNVSGANGTTGFCNVCVPTSLFNGTLSVFVNGTQVQYNLLPSSNSSISYLYFAYGHSTEEVTIVAEFQDFLILAMFMSATLLTIAMHKKKHIRS